MKTSRKSKSYEMCQESQMAPVHQPTNQPRQYLTYAEKLRDPRWQKKRLELLEASGWQCQCCSDSTKELQVHHGVYLRGKMPWEYEDWAYTVLCKGCHEFAQQAMEMGHIALAKSHRLLHLAILADGNSELIDALCSVGNLASASFRNGIKMGEEFAKEDAKCQPE